MAIPGSVPVGGYIAPFNASDTYATQDEIYNRGGWRTVATIAARNAITADRRREGMLVRVTSMPTCMHALCPHSHLHAAQVGGQRKIIGAPRALRLPARCGC